MTWFCPIVRCEEAAARAAAETPEPSKAEGGRFKDDDERSCSLTPTLPDMSADEDGR